MKKIHFLFAACLFLIGTATASAQFMGSSSRVSSSVEGYNSVWLGFAPTTLKSTDGLDLSISGFNSFSVGVMHTAPLQSLPLLWEVGGFFEFTHKSGDVILMEDAKVNVLSIKVPINVLYAFPVSEGVIAYPYIGLNARGYLSGKIKGKEYDIWDDTTTSTTIDIFNNNEENMDGDAFKRFTIGYQLGVRLGFSKYFASIGYGSDLMKIQEKTNINMVTFGVGMAF